jgi:hypothetical protein
VLIVVILCLVCVYVFSANTPQPVIEGRLVPAVVAHGRGVLST